LAADGKVASRAADDVFYAMVPGVQRETHDLFGTDEKAVCRSTFRGTTTDGQAFELPCLSMIYLRDGLVAESWLYLDLSAFQ
jgi:ketosteroid isomerase-like protein